MRSMIYFGLHSGMLLFLHPLFNDDDPKPFDDRIAFELKRLRLL